MSKNSLINQINEFMDARLQEEHAQMMSQNTEYVKNNEISTKLWRIIKDLLPEEHKHLMHQYDNTESCCHALEVESAYKKGLMDGIKFFSALKGE